MVVFWKKNQNLIETDDGKDFVDKLLLIFY